MDLREEINTMVAALPAELTEKKGVYSFCLTVAERRTFLARQRLVYCAKFRIDDRGKEVVYAEMLKEKGFGLGLGSGMDGPSPGIGFKKSVYKTGSGPREETIVEQSNLFGKKYSYTFDFGQVRDRIKAAASAAGYAFSVRLTL